MNQLNDLNENNHINIKQWYLREYIRTSAGEANFEVPSKKRQFYKIQRLKYILI